MCCVSFTMLSHSVKHKWLLVCEILTLWEAVEELGLHMRIADSHLPSHQGRAANYWKWNFTYSWTVTSSLASFIFLSLDKKLQLNSYKLNVGVESCTCIISFHLDNNLTRLIGSCYYFPHVIPTETGQWGWETCPKSHGDEWGIRHVGPGRREAKVTAILEHKLLIPLPMSRAIIHFQFHDLLVGLS